MKLGSDFLTGETGKLRKLFAEVFSIEIPHF